MITFQEDAERACMERCQLIDSLLRGDGKIASYDVDISKYKKSYVGFANRVYGIIKSGDTTRHEIKDLTNTELQVVTKTVNQLKSDGVVTEHPSTNGRRLLRVVV